MGQPVEYDEVPEVGKSLEEMTEQEEVVEEVVAEEPESTNEA